MGCGGSKVDLNHDEIPSTFKPILEQRFEEIRSKRTDDSTNDLSTKELLIEDSTKFDNEERNPNEVNSIHPTFHVTQDCPPTLQKISLTNTSLKLSQGQEVENEINICDDNDKGKIARKRQMSQGSLDDEFELDDYDPSELRYGSPSFKVYYCSGVSYEKDDDNLDEEVTVEDQRNSISQESSCSNDVSVKQIPTRKEKRRRKFKLTMPNGGKFLHNMHSLYNFPCSSQSHAHLLQKASS